VDDDRGTDSTDVNNEPDATGGAEDPAWRLTAWVLPAGAGASALLTAVQTIGGGLGAAAGYPAALALALLAALLLRDARRRAARARWARDEVHEFALPLGVLLVTLVLLSHGADVIAYAPALLALAPVAWEFACAPRVERLRHLFPRALPVLNVAEADAAPAEQEGHGLVEAIVRDVLDGLPPDIAARLEPWSVEVQDEAPPMPGRIVYGTCFTAAPALCQPRRGAARGGHVHRPARGRPCPGPRRNRRAPPRLALRSAPGPRHGAGGGARGHTSYRGRRGVSV